MSTRADSTKKSNVFNEANEALYDPYLGFHTDEIFTSVPWPGKTEFLFTLSIGLIGFC